MTEDKDFKKLVRARAERTGESYSTARRRLRPQQGTQWKLSHSATGDYVHAREGTTDVLKGDGPGRAGEWSLLEREVDARPYARQRVHIQAQVRVEDVHGETMMNVRADDVLGRPCFIERLGLDVRVATWQDAETVFEVSPLAVTLRLGVVLVGTGRLRVRRLEAMPAGMGSAWAAVRAFRLQQPEAWDDWGGILEDSVTVHAGGLESQLAARTVHLRVDELVNAVTASPNGVLTLTRASALADLVVATREAAGTWHLSVVTADVTRQRGALRRDELIGLLRTWLAGHPMRATEAWNATPDG